VPYEAEISRTHPTAFLFLIDQSGSMDENMPEGISKARGAADAINKLIENLVTRCSKGKNALGEEDVRDYFYLGVIGYNGHGLNDALPGPVALDALRPISSVARHPLRVEERQKSISDGAGGVIQVSAKFLVWFDPVADGGTPMCEALRRAAEVVATFLTAHPDCFPPLVVNITDGQATDGDPEPEAAVLRELTSTDGGVLLFNVHISGDHGDGVFLPADQSQLGGTYARQLFRMSSQLPPLMLGRATDMGFSPAPGARGFAFRAGMERVIELLDIGTRADNIAQDR
jgi:hypothetical protein